MRQPLSILLMAFPLAAQAPAPPADAFAPLRFLLGTWVGDGGGQPGTAAGEATFDVELDGKVLVRRSFAEVAGSPGRPAFRHEDRMTLYPEGGRLKALYVDNEGHVIHYGVSVSGGTVEFLSEPGPGPRFRLTYRPTGTGTMALAFDIAPPGQPEAFRAYLQAALRRKP